MANLRRILNDLERRAADREQRRRQPVTLIKLGFARPTGTIGYAFGEPMVRDPMTDGLRPIEAGDRDRMTDADRDYLERIEPLEFGARQEPIDPDLEADTT